VSNDTLNLFTNHQESMKELVTKNDLNKAMRASADAIAETEQRLVEKIDESVKASEGRILDAINRIEKLYDVDRRLRACEEKLGIEA